MAKQISGIIYLDGVPLQTEVRLTDAQTGALETKTNSNATGRYSLPSLADKPYYVQAITPSGYRPLMHGPLAPYEPPTIDESDVYGVSKLEAYSATLSVNDTEGILVGPYKWSIAAGSLPQGLHLENSTTNTATISGVTDVAVGRYDVTIQLEDSQGVVFSGELKLRVNNRTNSGYVLDLQPDHFWKCDDANTGLYDEVTGGTQNAGQNVLYQQPSLVSNEVSGYSVGFDSNNPTYAELDTKLINIENRTFTIGAVIKLNDYTRERNVIFCNSFSQNLSGVLIQHRYGKLQFSFLGGGAGVNAESDSGITDNNKHSIAFAVSPSHVNFYIDGALVGNKSSNVNPGACAYNLLLASALTNAGMPSFGTYNGGFDIDNIFIDMANTFSPVDILSWHNNVMKPYEPQAPIAPLSINGSLPPANANTAYNSTTDITIAGTNTPITASTSGAFPAGWSVAVNGNHIEVTGPGLPIGDYTFAITVTDANNNTATLPLFLEVQP